MLSFFIAPSGVGPASISYKGIALTIELQGISLRGSSQPRLLLLKSLATLLNRKQLESLSRKAESESEFPKLCNGNSGNKS